ncbi:MAG TPA: thiamine-phosphate kinase [Tepidisphaeraceae bacterium]|jgi:thiamine-monophosphate kinase
MSGEFDFISWIRAQQARSGLVQLPAGDDLAVLRWNANDLLLVGVDQVLDGVHFDSRIHTPRQIGKKVMNRNLSDCAAMACLPGAAVATVALPKGMDLNYAKELYLGLKEAADGFDCPLVGGDTGSWNNPLTLTVTILGKSAGITPVTRSGAKSGDILYVTGKLGGSILGRHMTFTPQIHLARELAMNFPITSMLDISDGLSRDLRHICQQSHVGAIVDAGHVPIHDDATALSHRDGVSPLDHALHDGEDHELLFTSPSTEVPAIRIGRIIESADIQLQTIDGLIPLAPKGWEHKL